MSLSNQLENSNKLHEQTDLLQNRPGSNNKNNVFKFNSFISKSLNKLTNINGYNKSNNNKFIKRRYEETFFTSSSNSLAASCSNNKNNINNENIVLNYDIDNIEDGMFFEGEKKKLEEIVENEVKICTKKEGSEEKDHLELIDFNDTKKSEEEVMGYLISLSAGNDNWKTIPFLCSQDHLNKDIKYTINTNGSNMEILCNDNNNYTCNETCDFEKIKMDSNESILFEEKISMKFENYQNDNYISEIESITDNSLESTPSQSPIIQSSNSSTYQNSDVLSRTFNRPSHYLNYTILGSPRSDLYRESGDTMPSSDDDSSVDNDTTISEYEIKHKSNNEKKSIFNLFFHSSCVPINDDDYFTNLDIQNTLGHNIFGLNDPMKEIGSSTRFNFESKLIFIIRELVKYCCSQVIEGNLLFQSFDNKTIYSINFDINTLDEIYLNPNQELHNNNSVSHIMIKNYEENNVNNTFDDSLSIFEETYLNKEIENYINNLILSFKDFQFNIKNLSISDLYFQLKDVYELGNILITEIKEGIYFIKSSVEKLQCNMYKYKNSKFITFEKYFLNNIPSNSPFFNSKIILNIVNSKLNY